MDSAVVRSGAIILLGIVLLSGAGVTAGEASALNGTNTSGPTAAFDFTPGEPLPDEEVTFDASESEGTITDYDWEYEYSSGSSTYTSTASGETITNTWDYHGKYDVTLTVTDDNEETDSVTKTITVDAEPPTAAIEFSPSNPKPDEEVTLDASDSTAPAGSIEDYDWEYEYSSGSSTYTSSTSGEMPAYTWNYHGSYDVTLTVTDNGGKTDSITKTVTVGAETPTADFEFTPSDPTPDEEVTLDASGSTAPAGSIEDYDWEYEYSSSSGNTYTSSKSGKAPTYTWNYHGTYNVTLTVTDNGGKSDSVTKTITVGAEPPTADFEFTPADPNPDEEVTLDASTSTAPAGSIEDYDWEYEYSSSSGNTYTSSISGETPRNTWNYHGTYNVTLTVTDNGGKTDSTTETVTVGGDGPTAAFDYTPSTPDPGREVTFDGTNSLAPDGNIESYDWTYEYDPSGYTSSASGRQFTNAFDEDGEYDVTLTVTDNGGKVNSTTKTVVVGDVPDFAVTSMQVSNGIAVAGEFIEINATVTNQGDAEGTQNVRLRSRGAEITSEEVTLAAGTSESLSFDVTVPDESGEVTYGVRTDDGNATGTLIVLAEEELDDAAFDARIVDTSAPIEGEDLTLTVEVENTGQQDGTRMVEANAGGLGVATRSVTLAGGASTRETFSFGTGSGDAGSRAVEITTQDTTVTSTAEIREPAELFVSDLVPTSASITQGDTIDVSATVENIGDASTDGRVEWRLDGDVIDSTTITLDGGQSTTVAFQADSASLPIGESTHGVYAGSDSTTGTLTVEPPDTPSESTGDSTDDSGETTDDPSTEDTPTGSGEAQAVTTTVEQSTEDTPDGGADDPATTTGKQMTTTDSDGDGASVTTTAADSGSGTESDGSGLPLESLLVVLLGGVVLVGGYGVMRFSGTDDGTSRPDEGDDGTVSVGSAPGLSSSAETTGALEYGDIEQGELIGSGGFADVYRATVPTPEGPLTIALKEPRIRGTLNTDHVSSLLEEAENWSKLDDHRHIVDVIDYGSDPLPWIAMEYMDAGPLGQYAGEMDTNQAVQTALAVTKGVRHAHRQGIAHLDLNPENVLLQSRADGPPVPKVADWGLSKELLEHSMSMEGLSPQYAAPEQFDDEYGPADDITDIYQLGAVFYDLFTGRPPFEGKPTSVMRAVMDEQPTPPSAVADVPDGLDDVLLKALAKDKTDRYDDIVYLRDALQRLADGL